MFHEKINGSKIKSYGLAKRFSFEKSGVTYSVLGGMVGAPVAAIIVENALASGAESFKAFGTAGWIGKTTCETGSLMAPRTGKDETGMVKDYGGESDVVSFNSLNSPTSCHGIVSVNSFYRLTREKVINYRKQQIEMIDMEAAPLHYIITKAGGKFSPIFVVSDYVDNNYHWTDGTKTTNFQKGLEKGLTVMETASQSAEMND